MNSFVPDAGDLVWLTFDPQAGREQSGRRPALVLSPKRYNRQTSLAIVCPITNQKKGYPFEVTAPPDCGITGVFLADHVKSLDWKVRQAELIASIPPATLSEVLSKLAPLLGY